MANENGIVSTRQAARGTQKILTLNAPPLTIAQLELDGSCVKKDGVAKGVTIVLNTIIAPNVAGVPQAKSVYIKWTIQYGYGGQNITKILTTQSSRVSVVGDWFRVSAQMLPTGGSPNPAISTTVSAFIAPDTDGQTRWGSLWNYDYANPAANFFNSYVGADRYLLSSVPTTLWRINGYRYDTGTDTAYLQLFDIFQASDFGGVAAPQGIVGAVTAGATFSLDLSLSGRSFFNGIGLASSSTGNTYTQDAAVLLALDCELLSN